MATSSSEKRFEITDPAVGEKLLADLEEAEEAHSVGRIIYTPPPTVGYFLIGSDQWGTHLMQTRRPNWFRQLMHRWLLDWVWVDKNSKEFL